MILKFLKTAIKLKNIPRQGWIEKLFINEPESVADHTFSLAIMSMVFSDLEGFDTEKVLKIVLLHDLAEAITGDLTPSQISKKKKDALETKTINKILDKLPVKLKKQYQNLWFDYQSNLSKESKLIHQLDKLEMVLQAKIYSKNLKSKEKIKVFYKSALKEVKDPKLKDLLIKIFNQK